MITVLAWLCISSNILLGLGANSHLLLSQTSRLFYVKMHTPMQAEQIASDPSSTDGIRAAGTLLANLPRLRSTYAEIEALKVGKAAPHAGAFPLRRLMSIL